MTNADDIDRHGNEIFTITDLPPVRGLRTDQLLSSDHFGLLGGTLDPELAATYDDYYALLAVEHPNDAQQEERIRLYGRLHDYGASGDSPREELAQRVDYIVKDYEALVRHPGDQQLKDSMKQKVRDLMDFESEDREYACMFRQVFAPLRDAIRNGQLLPFAGGTLSFCLFGGGSAVGNRSNDRLNQSHGPRMDHDAFGGMAVLDRSRRNVHRHRRPTS